MSTPWQPGNDPRLITSPGLAKAADVEARLGVLEAGMGPVAPGLIYGSTPTSVAQTANGSYTWTCPAGVTSAKIECWGAGAGGGGGASGNGGFGGGGGEYACEPAYPVVPGQVYTYVVGNGGTGGTTNNPGQDGSDTLFDNGGVYANGGNAHSGSTGGSGSGNTIVHSGGDGGANSGQTGGGGGGGSGGATGNGGNGGAPSGSTGGGAGGAGSGGGSAGGAGGNSASNGSNGVAPGGGGGAAGAASISGGSSGSSSYRLSSSATYRGADASGGAANSFRSDAGSSMMQGGTTASGGSYNGTQKALGIIGGNPQGDLSGKIIDTVSIRLMWTHTWYNNGAYIRLGYSPRTSLPGSWDGLGNTLVKTWWQGSVGSTRTTDLTGQGLGTALQSGAAQAITLSSASAMNLNYYGTVYGAGGSNSSNPLITVSWHTSGTTGTAKAGDGRDGQVKITYNVTGVLAGAVQPAAGTDDGGNAFAAGYTGQVTAIQPGSNPSVVETWHTLGPIGNGWTTAHGRYRLTADGELEIDIALTGGSGSGSSITWPNTLPAAYRPVITRRIPGVPGSSTCHTTINTTGAVSSLVATGGGTFDCCGRVPLD